MRNKGMILLSSVSLFINPVFRNLGNTLVCGIVGQDPHRPLAVLVLLVTIYVDGQVQGCLFVGIQLTYFICLFCTIPVSRMRINLCVEVYIISIYVPSRFPLCFVFLSKKTMNSY